MTVGAERFPKIFDPHSCRLVVNLWENEQCSDAARAALAPQVGLLLDPS